MAHVSEIRSNVAKIGDAPVVARILEMRDAMSTRLSQYRAYRVTLGELRNLSQRELDDLGIHRENIRDIALAAAMD